ncbi:hypothetical protein H7F33_11710 [Pedobacter sp. PAMC26386]|nr:hypothetical protein H7F33_11710 [Pedobacter sp. PAMC26386]
MKKLIVLLFILLSSLAKAQNCNCSQNFEFLVGKIKANYVGYRDKVNKSNQQRFDLFTDSLRKVARSTEEADCRDICQKWLSYFKDGHIGMSSFTPGNAKDNDIRSYFAGTEKTGWTEDTFNSYLKNKVNSLDGIEGIWSEHAGKYKIGIVKDSASKKDEYMGFIIKADGIYWMPQQVKLCVKKTKDKYSLLSYRLFNHDNSNPSFYKSKDTLDFGIYGKWYRGNIPIVVVKPVKETDLSPSFRILDKETNLLTIPYFRIRYKKAVDSIIEKNKALLEQTKHLIIDVRNNSGGSVYTFEKLLPYLYTNPIYINGGSVLATEDNIKNGYDIDDVSFTESKKKEIKETAAKLRAHLGELYPLYSGETLRLDSIKKNPGRVSILINGGCASSTEFFILAAEQSKKVTLFGENSGGAVDYIEVISLKMPCNYFSFSYPACRSFLVDKRPLDNIGIAPNVIIPENVQDWVEFVRTYSTNP